MARISKHTIGLDIPKTLIKIANEIGVNIRPIVRDELENTLRHEIYASYTPAVPSSERPYKHKNKLTSETARNVYGAIEGDKVQIEFKNATYPNGRTVEQVYNDLKFGTTDKPKNYVYKYGKNKYSWYIYQEPHNFEARTRAHMKIYTEWLKADIQAHPRKYIRKFTIEHKRR